MVQDLKTRAYNIRHYIVDIVLFGFCVVYQGFNRALVKEYMCFVCLYVYVSCTFVCVCLYIYTYMCVCVHICVFSHSIPININNNIYIYIYIYRYIYIYICMYIYMCVCVTFGNISEPNYVATIKETPK